MKQCARLGWLFLLFLASGQSAFCLSGPVSGRLDMTTSPYIVSDNVVVPVGQTLVIDPGVILKFSPGKNLMVQGTLAASGAAQAPIVFTSLRDDSAGGDTNLDGSATLPAPGDWHSLYIGGGATPGTASLVHVEIRYGGDQIGGQVFSNTGVLRIDSARISESRSGVLYVTEITPFTLSAQDEEGVDQTFYSLDESAFTAYAGGFHLASGGAHTLRYFSTAGNAETPNALRASVDTASPVTSLSFVGPAVFLGTMPVLSGQTFLSLDSIDPLAGGVASGVRRVDLRLDGGVSQLAQGLVPFTLPHGLHELK